MVFMIFNASIDATFKAILFLNNWFHKINISDFWMLTAYPVNLLTYNILCPLLFGS